MSSDPRPPQMVAFHGRAGSSSAENASLSQMRLETILAEREECGKMKDYLNILLDKKTAELEREKTRADEAEVRIAKVEKLDRMIFFVGVVAGYAVGYIVVDLLNSSK